jgi:hypothetical protein
MSVIDPSVPGKTSASRAPRAARPRLLTGPIVGLLTVLTLFILLLFWKGQLATFLSLPNLQVLLHKSSIPGVVALGALLVIVSGGIDLSAGSVVALVTVVTMQVYRLASNGPEEVLWEEWLALLRQHVLAWRGTQSAVAASLIAVPAGVLAGGVCGLGNGLMITRLRLTPFVATLGMMSVARGLAVWLAGRTRISFRGPRQDWVDAVARANPEHTLFDPGVWSEVLPGPDAGGGGGVPGLRAVRGAVHGGPVGDAGLAVAGGRVVQPGDRGDASQGPRQGRVVLAAVHAAVRGGRRDVPGRHPGPALTRGVRGGWRRVLRHCPWPHCEDGQDVGLFGAGG